LKLLKGKRAQPVRASASFGERTERETFRFGRTTSSRGGGESLRTRVVGRVLSCTRRTRRSTWVRSCLGGSGEGGRGSSGTLPSGSRPVAAYDRSEVEETRLEGAGQRPRDRRAGPARPERGAGFRVPSAGGILPASRRRRRNGFGRLDRFLVQSYIQSYYIEKIFLFWCTEIG
jgi:hypothetical protein